MQADIVEKWLSRNAPPRGVNDSHMFPIVLATETGILRTENQDRVASLIVGPSSHTGRSLIAVAIADGMGGMRDGARCASLTLSSFFNYLSNAQKPNLTALVEGAILFANTEVSKLHSGKGGSTLAAVVFSNTGASVIAHVGDSRIYLAREGEKLTRLTVDDSLEEAVGGHGRELLQFVGMGLGCQPHVKALPNNASRVALTTDGLHFLEHSVLEKIFQNCSHNRALVDRLIALARWAGGPDNATVAVIEASEIQKEFPNIVLNQAMVSDPFSSLLFSTELAKPIKSEIDVPLFKIAREDEIDIPQSSKKEKPASSKSKKPRKTKKPKAAQAQLEIKVESLSVTEDSGENSK